MKSKRSNYIEVSGDLRTGILSGKYPPGSRLPTERELSEQMKVSRVTVRRALRVLEQERLIRRRQGSGTYVSPTPARRIPVMIDYTGSVREHAPSLGRQLLLWRRQPAAAFEAESLGIELNSEILYAERLDILDGVPVACDKAFIVGSFASRLRECDLVNVDFIETWMRREQFSIEECQQTTEAVSANAGMARKLGLRRGQPVLKSTELFTAEHGRLAGLYVSFYHPAYICIFSRYRWTDFVAGQQMLKKGTK